MYPPSRRIKYACYTKPSVLVSSHWVVLKELQSDPICPDPGLCLCLGHTHHCLRVSLCNPGLSNKHHLLAARFWLSPFQFQLDQSPWALVFFHMIPQCKFSNEWLSWDFCWRWSIMLIDRMTFNQFRHVLFVSLCIVTQWDEMSMLERFTADCPKLRKKCKKKTLAWRRTLSAKSI